MKKVFVVLALLAIAVPAYGDTSLAFFGVTADGAFDNYRSSALGGYGNNGAGGATRMMKANQHAGFMSFYGAEADGSGMSIDQVVMANGGWGNPLLKFNLRFQNTDGGLPAVGAVGGSTQGGSGYQIGCWIQSVRVGAGAGIGQVQQPAFGLVEDQSASTGGDFPYNAPAPGFQGASELVAFRGAQPYLSNPDRFANLGEGIDAGPLGTAAGVAWFTPSGAAAAHTFGANAPVQWVVGTSNRGYNSGKDTWALEWLLGGYGNNGGVRAGGATGVNDWADSGQINAKDSMGNPIIVTAAYYNSSDPRGGLVNANNVAIPLDVAFVLDMATNLENRGLYFNNNVDVVGATYSNTGFYTKEQSGVMHPYLEIALVPEPMTLALLALGGLALIRRRR
jgi:hypothetical protein